MKRIGINGALCVACGIGALVWALAGYGAVQLWRNELQPFLAGIDITPYLVAGMLLSFGALACCVLCLALGWEK